MRFAAPPRKCELRSCTRTFLPKNPDHRYCSRKHAVRDREKRRKAATWDPNKIGRCPNPYKRGFATWDAAITHLAVSGLPGVYPYRCECGALHVGHPGGRIGARERANWDFRIGVRKEQLFVFSETRPCRHKYVRSGVCAVCSKVVVA